MFIDSHAHIDGREFDADREEVIERAHAAGVTTILNVGTGDPHSGAFERASSLGREIRINLHRHRHASSRRSSLRRPAEEKTKALINKRRTRRRLGRDRSRFSLRQLTARRTARGLCKTTAMPRVELDLPVIIHTREAEDRDDRDPEIGLRRRPRTRRLSLLQRQHGTGEAQHWSWFHDLVFRDRHVQESRGLREDRAAVSRSIDLLIETDCPYLAPVPHRGKRNEPAYVVEIARCVADLRGLDDAKIGPLTTENFTRLFSSATTRNEVSLVFAKRVLELRDNFHMLHF